MTAILLKESFKVSQKHYR